MNRTQLTLVLLCLAACSRVDDLIADPIPEFPDVGPYLHQPACVECLHASCAMQFDACMGDDKCFDEYECRRECSDPLCHTAWKAAHINTRH